MSTEEIRLTAIQSIQIAIGAIYLLTGTMMPFLTDRPILERFVWAIVFGLLPGLCIIAACVRKRWSRHRAREDLARSHYPEGLIYRSSPVTGDAYSVVKLFHRYLKDDSGGSSIQYAFIAVVIPVAFIVSVNCLGPKSNMTISTLGSATAILTSLSNE